MNNERLDPLPYQKEDVAAIGRRFDGRALLALDMGLGKTLITLWWLQRNPERTRPAIVVCPASVKPMWAHEAATHIGLRASIAEGRDPPTRTPKFPPKLTVVNYDILPGWVEYLKAMNPRTIIFDESQYLQSRESQRTKASAELSRSIPNRLALSGTPLTNRPSELWPTLNILRPDLYDSFWSFGHEFCSPRLNRGRWEYKGATNLDVLHKRLLTDCMIRRRKSDVLAELPDKIRRVVPCPLRWPTTGEPAEQEYARASNNFLGWLKQRKPGRVHRASRAERVTRIGYLLRLAAKLKVRAVVDWANRFLMETDEKLVLFGVHRKILRALERNINAQSVTIDGGTSGRMRQVAVRQFQCDKRTRVFIGNIKAAGTGIDGLQRAASTVGFAELWWRPGDHMQAEDRVHRMGQDAKSWIFYFTGIGTIDAKLCKIIQAKQETIRRTLDGEIVADDLNVFDQLMGELEK